MPKRGPNPFSGDMADWTPVTSTPPNQVDAMRPLSKPDRVAKEQREVMDKYLGDNAPPDDNSRVGNPHVDGSVEHSELLRAKKRGALDNNENAKTFVVRNNKIVGSQG